MEHFGRAGLSVRTLQQRFSGDVGVTPKRVICRYRLHEAIGWLAGGEPVDLAELAHALSGISIRLAFSRLLMEHEKAARRSGPRFAVLFVESAAPRGPCHIRRCGVYVSCIQPVFLYSDVLVQPFERSVQRGRGLR